MMYQLSLSLYIYIYILLIDKGEYIKKRCQKSDSRYTGPIHPLSKRLLSLSLSLSLYIYIYMYIHTPKYAQISAWPNLHQASIQTCQGAKILLILLPGTVREHLQCLIGHFLRLSNQDSLFHPVISGHPQFHM